MLRSRSTLFDLKQKKKQGRGWGGWAGYWEVEKGEVREGGGLASSGRERGHIQTSIYGHLRTKNEGGSPKKAAAGGDSGVERDRFGAGKGREEGATEVTAQSGKVQSSNVGKREEKKERGNTVTKEKQQTG